MPAQKDKQIRKAFKTEYKENSKQKNKIKAKNSVIIQRIRLI